MDYTYWIRVFCLKGLRIFHVVETFLYMLVISSSRCSKKSGGGPEMDKWKGATVVLAVLLLISVGLDVLIYQAADSEISSLQKQLNETKAKVIPGVYLSGNDLVIKNDEIKGIYFNPARIYVLDRGNRIFTKNDKFELDIAVLGGYYKEDVSRVEIKPGAHYTCVNLDAHDGLRVQWKVVGGNPRDWRVRLFNETGFEVYRKVITTYQPGDPNSAAALLDVQVEYQLMGSSSDNQKEGGFALGWDHGAGKYCVAFENWGSDPLTVELGLVVEKQVNLVDNG